MSTSTASSLRSQIDSLARPAGLSVVDSVPGQDFSGQPTERLTLALVGDGGKQFTLELSEGFDAAKFQDGLTAYLIETARRLRNPRPDCYLTMLGLPLSFGQFAWPFHGSTSGADTFIVHGEVHLETGEAAALHAKISASMTRTFSEIVAALEQPFAEGFIYNAVRKTVDQGQIEMVKSGNRQPVPVTTRYYSAKQQRFIFNDTTEAQRKDFVAAKVFWLSGVLGGGAPVWITDPRDAQYLNTTVEELHAAATRLAGEGLLTLSANGEDAVPTQALMDRRPQYEAEVQDALDFLKPSFNEEMRGGHTNM